MSEFQFRVKHGADGFTVDLPHQCDRWEIAGSWSTDGAPQSEALADLDQFIAEANEARRALAEGREIGLDR